MKLSVSDAILIQKIQEREYSSFLTLYERYWNSLYDMVFLRTKDKTITEELLQNLWIKVWTEPEQLTADEKGNASGFLFRSAHFRIQDYYRNRYRNANVDLIDDLEEDLDRHLFEMPDDEYFEILKEGSIGQLLEAVEDIVKTMSPTEQTVYDFRINQLLSVEETAAKMGVSKKTVSNNLSKVLSEVRSQLAPEYKSSKKMIGLLLYLQLLSELG